MTDEKEPLRKTLNLPKGSGVTTDSPWRDPCELCGKRAELRPYGPRGERICFACGMKDEKTTQRQFMCVVFDEGVQ